MPTELDFTGKGFSSRGKESISRVWEISVIYGKKKMGYYSGKTFLRPTTHVKAAVVCWIKGERLLIKKNKGEHLQGRPEMGTMHLLPFGGEGGF